MRPYSDMEGPHRRGPRPIGQASEFREEEDQPERKPGAYEASVQPMVAVLLGGLLLCGLLLIGVAALLGSTQDLEWQPHRITHEVLSPIETQARLQNAATPALRGCCGAPTEFLWVFLDNGKEAVAGEPFRTRIFARDAKGRQARPVDCEAVHVDLSVSGRARLLQVPAWKRAALELDIENERAEVVQAEVRIESPDPAMDVLLHTSQISFASGPAHLFKLEVRPQHGTMSPSMRGPKAPWPTSFALDVVVTTQDRFGNRVPLTATGLGGLKIRSSAGSSLLEMTPSDGNLLLVDRNEEGSVHIKGLAAGNVELWLEPVAQNISVEFRADLRRRTSKTLTFATAVNPNGPPPAEASEATLSRADAKWRENADRVKRAVIHAWEGYTQHAWGRDELQPKSHSGKDSFGGIGMTVIDSLTTLWLMGLAKEFDEALAFVQNELDFNKADAEVSVFELVIRGVGGLAGAHALSGRQVFLDRAQELADRLLGAFNTSSKLPVPKWNVARRKGGAPSGEPTILSEAGSCQLEFRYLTQQTGERRFQDTGDAAFEAIQSGGMTGLLPVYLTSPDVRPVRALASKFAFGALTDSYYEYLLKQWLQNPSERLFKEKWIAVMDELPGLIRPRPTPSIKQGTASVPSYKMVEVAPGGEPIWKMDHLSCFAPGMIVLGLRSLPASDLREKDRNNTWMALAEGLTKSCVEMWTSSKSGLAPEFMSVHSTAPHDFKEVPRAGRHSFLRPETAESLFYLHRYTGDEKYRDWGLKMFNAIRTHGQVDGGFASVQDVNKVPTEKVDEMQSFVMAETFKYLYLLFSPADRLDLNSYVLNTEGHPLLRPPLHH